MSVRLNNISIKCMLAILLAGLFASCKDEMDEYEGDRPSRLDALAIKFNAFGDGFQKPTTRAGVMEDFSVDDKVSVLSMMSPNGTNWSQVFATDAVEITNVGEYLWSYENKQKWTDGNTYKFRGFYPSSASGFNTTAGEECTTGYTHNAISGGSTTLTLNNYKSANDPRNNTDLMVSDVVERTFSKRMPGSDEPVKLDMKHLLACVNFNITNNKGSITIEHFKLRNHVTEASYDGNKWTSHYDFSSSNATEVFKFVLASNNSVIKDNNVNWGHLHNKEFYVEYKDDSNNSLDLVSYSAELFDNSKNPISSSSNKGKDYCVGLLLIPQKLEGKDEIIKIDFGGDKYAEGKISHKVEAVIQYKFEGNTKLQTAIVDLSANGKVPEWEAGKKYNYTVGLYEYQATANITIEDWMHHTFEEELK